MLHERATQVPILWVQIAVMSIVVDMITTIVCLILFRIYIDPAPCARVAWSRGDTETMARCRSTDTVRDGGVVGCGHTWVEMTVPPR